MEEKIMTEVPLQILYCLVVFSYLYTKIKVVCLAEVETVTVPSKTGILNSKDSKVKIRFIFKAKSNNVNRQVFFHS